MFTNAAVGHNKYGIGRIVRCYDDKYDIKFDDEENEITISQDAWLDDMFLIYDDDCDLETYNLRFSNHDAIMNKLLKKQRRNDLLKNKDYFHKRCIIDNIARRPLRNIVIINKKKIELKGKSYLNIIGLDVFSGKIIKIIDTNGAELGLHTYKEYWERVQRDFVIQAEFKPCISDKYLNLFRITSEFKIIGKSNLPKLQKKYKEVIKTDIWKFVLSFDKALIMPQIYAGKEFNTIVRFSGSEVKKYTTAEGKNRYQIKMDNTFVNIIDPCVSIEEKVGLYYRGQALISIQNDSFGNKRIFATRMFGNFDKKEKLEAKKICNNNVPCFEEKNWNLPNAYDCCAEDMPNIYEHYDFNQVISCSSYDNIDDAYQYWSDDYDYYDDEGDNYRILEEDFYCYEPDYDEEEVDYDIPVKDYDYRSKNFFGDTFATDFEKIKVKEDEGDDISKSLGL